MLICLWSGTPGGLVANEQVLKGANAFFQDDKVWDVALTVSQEDYALIQPKGRKGFGADFEYVRANVLIGGRFYEEVGLRYKGNSSFSAANRIPKKSFKIDFNRFVKGQKFLGLTKLNFNNNVLDPSQIREALAYRLWRRLDLPGSRTTFARLTLTVPGRFKNKLLGLYVVVEQVNGPFLRERFSTDQGLLLKPERNHSMPYLGQEFTEYLRVYVPKTKAEPSLTKRLIEFTWLIHRADDSVFAERIEGFVELDRLARFTAAHAVLSHLDSFLLRGHNYYLYLPQADGKFAFLPWDLNSTFASHRSAGSAEQQFNLSVKRPFAQGQSLLERLMRLKAFRESYDAELKKLMKTHFEEAAILRDMWQLRKGVEATVKEDEYSDSYEFENNFETPKEEGMPEGQVTNRMVRKPLLREFVAKRHESISAQLAGERESYRPRLRQRPGQWKGTRGRPQKR